MASRKVIGFGDTIRVLEPILSIKRVGYRINPHDVVLPYDLPTKEFLDSAFYRGLCSKSQMKMFEALQYDFAAQHKFGGNDKVVIRDEHTVVQPGDYYVQGTKIKKLGTYVPASVGYTWDRIPFNEPAYFESSETVKLIYLEDYQCILATECQLVR